MSGDLTEKVLRIVRRVTPSLITRDGKWVEVQPMKELPVGWKKEPFDRMLITGGLCHDFLKGWIYRQYKLEVQKGEKTIPPEGLVWYTVTESSIVDSLPEEVREIPEDILEKWNTMTKEYNDAH